MKVVVSTTLLLVCVQIQFVDVAMLLFRKTDEHRVELKEFDLVALVEYE